MSTKFWTRPPLTGLTSPDRKPESFTCGRVETSKNVEWYQPTLKKLSDTAVQVFRVYSGIPEDQIIDHIYRVRDKAWNM